MGTIMLPFTLYAVGLLSGGLTGVFQVADTHNADGDHTNSDPGEQGKLIAHENGKQKHADDTGSVLNGVRDGFLQEPHTEVGEGHGDDVKQRNGKIADDIDGKFLFSICYLVYLILVLSKYPNRK